jgi:hypothetical protein
MSNQINAINSNNSSTSTAEILTELRKDTSALNALLALNLDRNEIEAVRLIGARVSAGLCELDAIA